MISVCFRVSWKSRVSRSSFLIEISLQIFRPSRCHPGSRKAHAVNQSAWRLQNLHITQQVLSGNIILRVRICCAKKTANNFNVFALCFSLMPISTWSWNNWHWLHYFLPIFKTHTPASPRPFSFFLLQINIKTGNGRLNLPR